MKNTITLKRLLLIMAVTLCVMLACVLTAGAYFTGFVTTELRSDGIYLEWADDSVAESYTIYRYDDEEYDEVEIGSTEDTYYVDSDIEAGKTYYYNLDANYSEYEIDSLASEGIYVEALVAPDVSIKMVRDSFVISWDEVNLADGYNVYRKAPGGAWELLTATEETSYTDSGLHYGDCYYYTVRAYNSFGMSKYEAPQNAMTNTYLVAPALVSASSSNAGIRVRWNAIPGAQGYYVYRKTTGGWSKVATVSSAGFTDVTASYGTTYYYTVRAYEGTNYSGYSSVGIRVKMTSLITPKISSLSGSYNYVNVRWSRTLGSRGYYIYRSTGANGKYSRIATVNGASVLSYRDTRVTVGTSYYYKVVAFNGTVRSAASAPKGIIVRLIAPVITNSANSTPTSITIRWAKVAASSGYYVYRKTLSGSWVRLATISSRDTVSYTDKTARGTYCYRVYSYNNVNGKRYIGNGSAVIQARVLGAVQNVQVDQVGDSFRNVVTWNKCAGATSYQVYYKIGSGAWKYAAVVSGTSYTRSVTHGKYYYYKVRAISRQATTTNYGPFSSADSMMIYYEPEFSVYMSDKTNENAAVFVMYVENTGNATLRIYSSQAMLIDDDYASYDRNLALLDVDYAERTDKVRSLSYIDIPAGTYAYVSFYVTDDYYTWYDSTSRIYYNFSYDSMYYRGYSSAYYGSQYWS